MKNAASFDPDALHVDLSDRTVVITGANSGLGKETALEMAKRGKFNLNPESTVHLFISCGKYRCTCPFGLQE